MTLLPEKLDTAFLDTVDELRTLGASADVAVALKIITERYGLKHTAYLAHSLPGRSHKDPFIAVTYSSDWIKRYSDLRYVRHDPVVAAGLSSIMPIDWHDVDRSGVQERRLFGEAREFGVGRHGLTFPIRGRYGDQAIFSITSDESDAEWDRIRRLFMRDFQVLAYHVHQLVLRAEAADIPTVKLSPREIDCLRWAGMGKTAAEIAQILGIGVRTSRFYLETARHKLGAINVTNAVAKALSLSLISISV